MIFTLDLPPELAVSLVERTVAESAQGARARSAAALKRRRWVWLFPLVVRVLPAPAVYAGARCVEEAALQHDFGTHVIPSGTEWRRGIL